MLNNSKCQIVLVLFIRVFPKFKSTFSIRERVLLDGVRKMGEFWNPLRVSKNVTRTTGTTVGDSMITGLLLQEISTYVLSLVVTSQTNVLESYKRLILFTQAK